MPDRRRAELFADLRRVHDLLTDYQDKHNKTQFGCQRSGHCCKVGLQLSLMECELIADELKVRYQNDPKGLAKVVSQLKRAFDDPTWNWSSSIGDQLCAFYEDGCTIYPFRPSICRMYGVVLEVDEWCPRERLSDGRSFVYVQPDVDRMIALYYRTLDNYGRLFPEKDYTVYMPRGVLSFLVSPAQMAKLRARTDKRFWKREKGYRTQFKPSYRRGEGVQTNVKFPFAIPRSS